MAVDSSELSSGNFYRHLTGLPPTRVQEEASAGTARVVEKTSYTLEPDSVGYRLLKKSGWKEGSGLGPEGKGCKVPLEPWLNRGRRGVGCADQRQSASEKSKEVSKPKSQKRKGETDSNVDRSRDSETEEEKQLKITATREKAKRRRQAAIQRAFCREFNEQDSEGGTNPLTRRNRLSELNPLLDD